MSVTIIRLKNGEHIDNIEKFKGSNPWDISELKDYLHFCCPECEYKSKHEVLFRHHMKENHETFESKRVNAKSLIQKFLEEDSSENNQSFPSCIDAIENPPLNLPVKNYKEESKSLPIKDPKEYSVSIFKVQNPNEDYDDKEEYFDESFAPSESCEDVNMIEKPQEQSEDVKMIEKDSKKCQDCSIVFLTSFRLHRHIKKFHGGVTPTMASSDTPIGDDSNVAEMPRPYSCQLCQKSFTSHAYLSSHIRKAHEKRFRCEECGKSYGGSSYLREHIEAVHRKTKNFTCESCAASFYSKTQLTNHYMRNHSQGEDKPCPECGKIFTNDLSLKLHLRNVHQPVKSMCSQCGKEYPNEVSLKKHVQCVHEKKRPYQCHICSKMFGSKWYVQQHVSKMHEDLRTFKCNECNFEFPTLRDKNAHVVKEHTKKPEESHQQHEDYQMLTDLL